MSRQLLRLRRALPTLRQGATLSIRSSYPQKIRVHVIPEWRADGHVVLVQPPGSGPSAYATIVEEKDMLTSMGRIEPHVSVHVGLDGNQELVEDDPADDNNNNNNESFGFCDILTLTATVPEKINLKCDLPNGGDVSVSNKIEGDIHINTADGDITVKKLRGHAVNLATAGRKNVIYVSSALEAKSLNISTPGRVRAKRILGESINIEVVEQEAVSKELLDARLLRTMDDDDQGAVIDVSSLYASGTGDAHLAAILSREMQEGQRAVRVKSSHGHVSVLTRLLSSTCDNADTPIVALGGVNGSCDVSVEGATQSHVAGEVHFDSLSPGSVNVVSADAGNLSTSFAQSVVSDVRLASSPYITTIDARETLVDADNPEDVASVLKELGESITTELGKNTLDGSKISIQTSSFSNRPKLCCSLEKSNGILEYVDGWVEDSEGEKDTGHGGKIRIDNAAAQALHGFSKSESVAENGSRPLVVVATNGRIAVDVMNWVSSVARRFGMNIKEGIHR